MSKEPRKKLSATFAMGNYIVFTYDNFDEDTKLSKCAIKLNNVYAITLSILGLMVHAESSPLAVTWTSWGVPKPPVWLRQCSCRLGGSTTGRVEHLEMTVCYKVDSPTKR
jgi:hypothetical protein